MQSRAQNSSLEGGGGVADPGAVHNLYLILKIML
jgi:hypothetical protein